MHRILITVVAVVVAAGSSVPALASADLTLVSACAEAKGEQARDACTQEIADQNTDRSELPMAYYNRGAAYVNKDDYTEDDLRHALADFTMAISLQPDLGAAYYARGKTYEALGDQKNAAQDLATAERLNQ